MKNDHINWLANVGLKNFHKDPSLDEELQIINSSQLRENQSKLLNDERSILNTHICKYEQHWTDFTGYTYVGSNK